jgi:PEP-CTERM motif
MKKTHLLLIPALAVLGSSLCSAAVYNVKYLRSGQPAVPVSSLQGVLGSTGESWNQASGTYTGLIDSTGASSSINISGLSGGTDEGPATSIFTGNSTDFGKGNNQTISFSGLTNGGIYNIYIYSLSHNTASWGNLLDTERAAGAFTTTNLTGNGASQSLDNGITATNATTFTAGSNYVFFQSIVADGSGNVSIIADAKDGGAGVATRLHINGLQLEQVPEPSAAMLGALGVLALLRRRRA